MYEVSLTMAMGADDEQGDSVLDMAIDMAIDEAGAAGGDEIDFGAAINLGC